MTKKGYFYVTTPIYYASGKPHIGHVYTSIAADVIARWNRNIGNKVFFQTGTDEHGQKIKENAEKEGKTPQEFVDSIADLFRKLSDDFNFSDDYFLRTTDKQHTKFVQDMLQKSYDNGDIYKSKYVGLYCVGCERYYTEKELVDGKTCPYHKTEPQKIEEENYFFRLSNYTDKLLDFYKNNPHFLSPKSKSAEVLNRVKEGLQDISISRNKKKLNWGIELPFDSEHVTYVWFDALFNYLASTRFLNKEEFWPTDLHIIGHDISWFHNVYWPAMLMSVQEELPQKVFSHGLVLDKDGHKMSKSLGNGVDPYECVQKYGLDELRFYLLALGTFGEDLRFSYEGFIERINNDLNNDLGNFVSRVHGMTGKYCEGVVRKEEILDNVDKQFIAKLDIYKEFNDNMQELKFNNAIEVLWTAIRDANAYINQVAPWKEKDEKRLKTIMNTLCSTAKLFAEYIDCFMPTKAQRVFAQLNLEKEGKFEFEHIKGGHKLGEKDNIFEKVKKEEQPQEESKKREGFSSLRLVIGKVIEVGDHPEAEKLYKLKIDIGEKEPRQILTGLKDYYKPEELANKEVVIIANLKPAKMRGELSQGMILAAEDKNGVGILTPEGNVGDILECNGEKADSEKQIKVDHFLKVEILSDGKTIKHNDKEVTVNKKSISTYKGITGKVH